MPKNQVLNYNLRSKHKAAEILLHDKLSLDNSKAYNLVFMKPSEWKEITPPRAQRFIMQKVDAGDHILPIQQPIFVKAVIRKDKVVGLSYKVALGKRTMTGFVNDASLQLPPNTIANHIDKDSLDSIKTQLVTFAVAQRHIRSLTSMYVSEENYKQYLSSHWQLKFMSLSKWQAYMPDEKSVFVAFNDNTQSLQCKYQINKQIMTVALTDRDLGLEEGGILRLIANKEMNYLKYLALDCVEGSANTHKKANNTQLKRTVSAPKENFYLKRTIFGRKANKPGSQGSADQSTPEGLSRSMTALGTSYFSERTPGNTEKLQVAATGKMYWQTSPVTYVSPENCEPQKEEAQAKKGRGALPKDLPKKRNVLTRTYAPVLFEVLHLSAHRFVKGAGKDPNLPTNLVPGTKHANSSMTFGEDAVSAFVAKHGISLYIWSDVLLDDAGTGHKLRYHVSLTLPQLSADLDNPKLLHPLDENHYIADYPLLVDTRPSVVHQRPLFNAMEAFFCTQLAVSADIGHVSPAKRLTRDHVLVDVQESPTKAQRGTHQRMPLSPLVSPAATIPCKDDPSGLLTPAAQRPRLRRPIKKLTFNLENVSESPATHGSPVGANPMSNRDVTRPNLHMLADAALEQDALFSSIESACRDDDENDQPQVIIAAGPKTHTVNNPASLFQKCALFQPVPSSDIAQAHEGLSFSKSA